jgi:hypothetical protein
MIKTALFPDSAEDCGSIGIKFSQVKAPTKKVVQRIGRVNDARVSGATGSFHKCHHPPKIILKAQSIRFPRLS